MREQFCIPQIGVCNPSPGYPARSITARCRPAAARHWHRVSDRLAYEHHPARPEQRGEHEHDTQGITVPVVETLNPVPAAVVATPLPSPRPRRPIRPTSKRWV